MSRAILILTAALLLTGVLGRPATAGERIALLPVPVVNGEALNGRLTRAALRTELARRGFQLVPAREMRQALKELGIKLRKPLFEANLRRVRDRLSVARVFYARVLSVGQNPDERDRTRYTAVALINVLSAGKPTLSYTRQSSVTFQVKARKDGVVMSAADTARLAAKLLSGIP